MEKKIIDFGITPMVDIILSIQMVQPEHYVKNSLLRC